MSEQQSDVPRGVPASGGGAFYDMIANDPPPAIRSVTSDLLDQQLADRRPPRTRVERWVEQIGPDGRMGGRWEFVEER